MNRSSTPEWSVAVRELTDGRGVDHVVETGGVATLARSFASTAEEGVINVVAALDAGTLDVLALRNPVTIRRTYVGSRASFERMNRAIGANALHPVIDRSFAFAEAKEAFEYLQSRTHFGKVVVTGD